MEKYLRPELKPLLTTVEQYCLIWGNHCEGVSNNESILVATIDKMIISRFSTAPIQAGNYLLPVEEFGAVEVLSILRQPMFRSCNSKSDLPTLLLVTTLLESKANRELVNCNFFQDTLLKGLTYRLCKTFSPDQIRQTESDFISSTPILKEIAICIESKLNPAYTEFTSGDERLFKSVSYDEKQKNIAEWENLKQELFVKFSELKNARDDESVNRIMDKITNKYFGFFKKSDKK